MNGNGQVIVAGLFLLTTVAVAMFAVGLFELPTDTPETRPLQLMDIGDREVQFSPAPIEMLQVGIEDASFSSAPIELLLQYNQYSKPSLTPEKQFHQDAMQILARTGVTKIQAHSGACSGLY